ncbi:hypothetical protein BDW69DRAFT_31807 [Aspergillus filifer]
MQSESQGPSPYPLLAKAGGLIGRLKTAIEAVTGKPLPDRGTDLSLACPNQRTAAHCRASFSTHDHISYAQSFRIRIERAARRKIDCQLSLKLNNNDIVLRATNALSSPNVRRLVAQRQTRVLFLAFNHLLFRRVRIVDGLQDNSSWHRECHRSTGPRLRSLPFQDQGRARS